jgi:hypothetical protein
VTDLTAEAKSLLNNEAFTKALGDAREQLIAQAMACKPEDHVGRAHYLGLAKVVDRIAGHLGALIASDKPEAIEVTDYYEQRAKRRFSLFSNP